MTAEAEPDRDGVLIPFPASRLPAQPDTGAEVTQAADVLDGELLTEEQEQDFQRRKGLSQLPARVMLLVVAVRQSEQTAQAKAVTAYRVRKAPRDVTRLSWFVLRGHGRWIAKGWVWATHGDLRADARAARIAGDAETRRKAQEALRSDGRARWARLSSALRAAGITVAVLGVTGLVLWVVDARYARDEMWGWLAGVYAVLDVAGAVLPWLAAVAPIGWLAAAAWEGRDRTPGAGFLVRPDRDDADSWIDERMISQALAHLGIPPLDKFFKAGGALAYSVPARIDGDGTFAQIRLPMGVTAEMVANRRKPLAANLGRAALETWATEGDEAGILDLWVADKGKLGQGAGEWPLLREGTADVFEGVPIGKTQRGALINAPLFEANYLAGGKPGQGKTNFARVLALGASLDPTAELWVFVMGQSPDFKPLEPRLSRYRMGMDDSVAEAAVQALRDLLAEMERRGKVLEQQPGSPPKTSRKLANKAGLGLHWLGCWIDECHELFMHPTYGKEAAELAVRLIKRGRKYGISLILATQSPTKDSIPREVTRNISCGVAFCVGDHVANDGLLGSGKYRQGIRATELRFNVDRGTSVAVGLTDATFELVSGFYVPFEDGLDMVTPVINRAMADIGELRRTGAPRQIEDAPEVDFLADLAEAMGDDKQTRTQVILTRLAENERARYEGWTFGDLTTALAGHGIRPAKSHGHMVVRAVDVAAAFDERDDT